LDGAAALLTMPKKFVVAVGGMTAIALEALRTTWQVRRWLREYLDQCVFLTSVCILPVMLVSIPFGATISLQLGQLVSQIGAQSFTGAAAVTATIQQVAPVATALLIAGAGGSAMAADMGARNVRDELAAMEVMSVNPTHRLVTPRIYAAMTVGVLLVSVVIVAGTAGSFFFNVIVQGVSPGAFFDGATSIVQISDLAIALIKAGIFGFVAAVVACFRGMNCDRSPVGVGKGVTEAVVQTFLAVFILNYVLTTVYLTLYPPTI
jgi:phospholipid/cholesterol/gamma-HCH transport system permease protein